MIGTLLLWFCVGWTVGDIGWSMVRLYLRRQQPRPKVPQPISFEQMLGRLHRRDKP